MTMFSVTTAKISNRTMARVDRLLADLGVSTDRAQGRTWLVGSNGGDIANRATEAECMRRIAAAGIRW